MLRTDLEGLINQVQENPISKLLALIVGLIVLYCIVSSYLSSSGIGDARNNFANVMVLRGGAGNTCRGDIPKIDEAIIRAHIDLPNRDPKLLTTSMVVPAPEIKEETKKQTRMEILNMFYNTFDDDGVSISRRPQGLYVIP
jgi:hypothetical protein